MLRPLAIALVTCAGFASAGCSTTLPPAGTPPLQPTSIALMPAQVAQPGAWTTPPVQAPTLTRRPSLGVVESDQQLPLSLIENAQNPTFGTPGLGGAAERRLESGLETAAPWQVIVTGVSTYVWGGDFETGGNGPSLWFNNVRLSIEKPLDYFGRFGVALSYANRQYEWSGPNSLIAGTSKPFESVDTLRANVNLFQPVSRAVALVLTFSASLSAADGADLTDGFSWAVTGGGGYRFSEKFDAGLGFIVSDGFADGLFVIGGPQFTWRPSDQWQLSLQGTQLDLAWKPLPSWEMGLSGAFTGVRFRLPDDAPGDRPGGVVGDTRVPVTFWARYRGQEAFDIELRAGMDIWRYFTIENRAGHGEYSVEMDPAPFVGLRAIFRL